MNLLKPTNLIVPLGVFIILLIISPFDFALVVATSTYLFLSQVNYFKLFIISPLLFLAGIFLRNQDINIRFISDLTIDAYILFATGVVMYIKSREDFISLVKKFVQVIHVEKKLFSKKNTIKIVMCFFISVLLSPIFGGYIAALSGYALYSYIDRQFSGRIAVTVGLIFLVLAAGFIVANKPLVTEELENYIFLFLAIGTFQEIINLARQKKENEKELPEVQKESHAYGVNFSLPKLHFLQLNPRIIFVIILVLTLSLLLYYSYPIISKYKFSLPILKTPTPTVLPTVKPSPLPTAIPTPVTKVSTTAATLKILILNGTEITGLAGSTSAKLKKVGFKNVEIGNTDSSSYKNWEATLKKHDEDIEGILKNVLDLKTLTVREATTGAKFDIELIAGEGK